jgi:hypothetical protein
MSNLWTNTELLNRFKSELLCFLCYKLYIKYTPELEDILSMDSNILFHLKNYKENATHSPLIRDMQPTINFAIENEDCVDEASVINGWSIYDLKYLSILPIYKEPKKELPKQFQDIGTSVLLYIKNQFDHKKFKYLNINKNYTSKLYPEICHLFQLNSSQKQNFTENQLCKIGDLKQSDQPQSVSFITITNLCHFDNIKTTLKMIKKTLCKGGYLLIKDYDLKHHDHIYLYDAFYDLYRLLLDDAPIKQILNHKKNNYKDLADWIDYLYPHGFDFVAKCTTPIDKTHHGDIYMLFKKA